MSGHGALDFDFLVIGGGPAGSACAIGLANAGGRVALVEGSDFSRFRIGETLEPSLGATLQELGLVLEEQEWSIPCHGITASWGHSIGARRPSILSPLGNGWRIDRRKFDKSLFELAQYAGATSFIETRVVSAIRQPGRWTCTLAGKNAITDVRTAWIVTATGRKDALPFTTDRTQTWIDGLVGIAVVHHACPEGRGESINEVVVEAAPQGWWYSANLPDGARMAVFFTDADILPTGAALRTAFLLDQFAHSPVTRAASSFVAALLKENRWRGFDARSGFRRLILSDGWVAVGDAILARDPLSGRGVSEAIRSGRDVATWLSLANAKVGAREEVPAWIANSANRFSHYMTERQRIYSTEKRWSQAAFWQRRHTAVHRTPPRASRA